MKNKEKWIIPIVLFAIAVVLVLIPKDKGVVTFKDETLTKEGLYEKLRDEPYSSEFTFGEKVIEDQIVGILLEEKYGDKVSDEYVNEIVSRQAGAYGSIEAYGKALQEEGVTLQDVKNDIYMDELVNEAFKDYQPVTEEFLKEQYDKMIPRGKVFKLILVDDEETAFEVIRRVEDEVEDEDDFEKLVHEYSLDKDNLEYGGDYTVVEDFFDPAIEEAVIDLELGEFSKEPIKTADGYNIVMVTRAGLKLPYEEEKENLLREEYYIRRHDESYNDLIHDMLADHKEDININDEKMSDLVERIIENDSEE